MVAMPSLSVTFPAILIDRPASERSCEVVSVREGVAPSTSFHSLSLLQAVMARSAGSPKKDTLRQDVIRFIGRSFIVIVRLMLVFASKSYSIKIL